MTRDGWLDRDEMTVWLALLAVVDRLPAAIDAQLRRDHGLTRFEYYVLAMLSEAPGDARPMTELSFMTNGSLSRLSHAVSKLESKGLTSRQPDPENGRITIVTLTTDGRRVLEAAAPSHVAEVRRLLLDHIPEDHVPELASTLRPVAQKLLGVGFGALPWEEH